MFPNRFPGACRKCGERLAARAGVAVQTDDGWKVECVSAADCAVRAKRPKVPALATVQVGALSGIMALFGKAERHLKRPAVELGVPGFDADRAVRVSVASDRAKVPGSLTLLTAERYDLGGEHPERKWLGRILQDGTLHAARLLWEDETYGAAVAARLRAFAADPSKVGAEDGILLGRCCFCRKSLSDERSTAVGYGRKCASNFGLSWGERPAEFAAEPVRERRAAS